MPAAPATQEAWLSGPVEGVPALLQPVAHSLIQTRDELRAATAGLPADLLWLRPAGVASAGFHLRHMTGVLDRLFSYARDEPLTAEQRRALAAEAEAAVVGFSGDSGNSGGVTAESLAEAFAAQVEQALAQLRATDAAELTEPRGVGRARLPSTVLGLLSHAAEHTQRHLGQLLVTVRVARAAAGSGGAPG